MKDANVPKYLREDLPLFNAIIQDLFPDVDLPDTTNEELESSIVHILERQKLRNTPEIL